MAGRAPAIDLKLRLALRVAALAAVCFIAVAAYALFDSDRVAKAKASRIAEIVARDLSLQQSQAQWLSVSISSKPDLQGIAALMEPGLCIAYRDNAGTFRQGVAAGAPADEMAAPEIFASLYRAIFRPVNRSRCRSSLRQRRGWPSQPSTPPRRSARAGARRAGCSPSWLSRWQGLCVSVYAVLARALRPTRGHRRRAAATGGER